MRITGGGYDLSNPDDKANRNIKDTKAYLGLHIFYSMGGEPSAQNDTELARFRAQLVDRPTDDKRQYI